MTKYSKNRSKRIIATVVIVTLLAVGFVVRDEIYHLGSEKITAIQNADITFNFDDLKAYIWKTTEPDGDQSEVILKIGLVSDSHGYNENIKKSLAEMKGNDVDRVIHLGDFTAGGEEESFAGAYEYLEASDLPYTVIPGDHDFNWIPEHSRINYEHYFGESYSQLIDLENGKNGIGWLEDTLHSQSFESIIIFFSAKPLYNPYFSSKNDPLGSEIIDLLVKYGVKYAVAGDTHVFAEYEDQSYEFNLITVGAVGAYKSPLPQWVLMDVYNNGNVVFTPHPLVDF